MKIRDIMAFIVFASTIISAVIGFYFGNDSVLEFALVLSIISMVTFFLRILERSVK